MSGGMMKLFIFFLSLFMSINLQAAPEQEGAELRGKLNLDQLEHLPNIGMAPINDHCDCDDEKGKEKETKTKPEKRRLISLTIGLEEDNNGNRDVTEYDCTQSPNFSRIENIVQQVGQYTLDAFKQFVTTSTKDFSDQDKVCLANEFGSIGIDGYDWSDGIGLYTLEEMHKCMQENQAGRTSSCRTCAPIHHYTNELMEAMGSKCGLMANQNFSYGVNAQTGEVDKSFTKRGMHYIGVCKTKSGYHLINYYQNWKINAKTYQEAIDIGNIAMGEGNWAGNQITCLDKGKSSLAECSHVYLGRSTRYQLNEIQESINQVGNDQSPIHLLLTNLRQELRVAYSYKPEETKEITRGGDLKESKINYGLVSGYERYRGEHFAQAGMVRKSKTTISRPTDKTPSKISTQNLYIGVAGITGDGQVDTDDNAQHMASLVLYLKRKDQFNLTTNDQLSINTDFVFGTDLANGLVAGHHAIGQTNVVSLDYDHQLNSHLSLGASQRFSLMTDKANLPMPILGATTGNLKLKDLNISPSVKLSNETSIHFLHGGLQDETVAFQNSTQLKTSKITKHGTSLKVKADLGYTSPSLTGRDVFYDQGFWGEGKAELNQRLYQNGRFNLYLQAEGAITSGQRPAQFAIDPLTIEENPTRGHVNSGYNGFIRLGGEF